MIALTERGFCVVAVCGIADPDDICRFRQIGVDVKPWKLRKAGRNPIGDAVSIFSLFEILRILRPDIIFAHTIKPVIYGIIIARILGIPRRVAMVPGLGHAFMNITGLRHAFVSAVARVGYMIALRVASISIFHNSDDIAQFRHLRVLGRRSPAVRVFGSGVDTKYYSYHLPDVSTARFLMISRILAEKGVREFVAAARMVKKLYPDAQFRLVGGVDSNPSAIQDSEISAWRSEGIVDITGPVEYTKPHYEWSNIFVLPSYREGTPRTNLEAMATGRAIISTDAPGCRETVEHGITGLLVPVMSVPDLAAAMAELAGDLRRAEVMGIEGRRLCLRDFELGKVTEETVALIVGGTVPAPPHDNPL